MADQISALPHNHQPFPTAEQLQFLDEINYDGADNPSLDDLIDGMLEDLSGGGNQSTDDSPQLHSANENSSHGSAQFAGFPPQPVFGNPVRIPVWPVPPAPHSCSCCQTLRDIFHVNGCQVFKLGIHGRLGIISHAVLERYDNNQTSQNHEFYMFDFCNESMDNVKQFLIQYCNERALEGCTMLQDPLSTFYDALLTGYLHQQTSSPGNNNAGQEIPEDEEEQEDANGVNPPKSYIASQRERAGKMKLKDLAKYFHLPINDAAKEMKLCASAIKGICRKEGLERWPYRKIKSLKNEIAKVSNSISSAGGAERSRLVGEKQRLEGELAAFYQEK
ncbi:uncharacterized protein LOC125214764 [Salvia hispanica]|uniref:uncharacterized protein LOC125214764 n=1 Tax=Salvia hispanica TaxID=49212 RepID=UPI002009345A|nr:uncharacterized protein LOC125214764 [Salvia hispanica]